MNLLTQNFSLAEAAERERGGEGLKSKSYREEGLKSYLFSVEFLKQTLSVFLNVEESTRKKDYSWLCF